MKILVMGSGALGSVFGGFLSRRHEVTMIGRNPHVEAVRTQGLRVSGIWGDHHFANLKARTQIIGLPIQDLVLITTKSYDTAEAVQEIVPLLHQGSLVISMQNGIGNEETIANTVGKKRTIGGMAIFGAVLVDPGHAHVNVYASECKVGTLEVNRGQAKRIAEAFTACGIPTLSATDILSEKWMKAFYNIALNPLSAILQVPYGVLGEMEETRTIMSRALKEAFAAAAAANINLETSAEGYFEHLLRVQLPLTAQHRSSMLQDIQKGRRTEIDYLNGVVVALGQRHGIATPVNEVLVGIMRALEKRED